MRRFFLLFILAVAGLFLALLANTLMYRSQQTVVSEASSKLQAYPEATLRLAEALRIKTISVSTDLNAHAADFVRFHQFLATQFPQVHATLQKEVINNHSLLFHWQGSDPSLKPVLYMAHSDVVPADTSKPEYWQQAPFSGAIIDGFVWGRGALDNKSSLMGLLEATEQLIGQGFQPKRSIYFAFGHDEELGGKEGNQRIAAHLQQQGVQLSSVLDEGFFVLDGMIPGLPAPAAMIGIAEKGFLSLKLSTESEGGHSSTPPQHTAIGILSQAINRLEDNPVPGGLDGLLGQTFAALGAEMPFLKKMIFANLWLFQPVVEKQLAAKPSTNALMRTTTAVTMIEGGIKENVLPNTAWAVVNFRISPTDSIGSVISYVRNTINDDRISIEKYGEMLAEPSAISSTKSDSYQQLANVIRQHFPGAIVAPANVVGATDSRHYQGIADNIYRFMPVVLSKDDISRFHGHNERIAINDYQRLISFYYQLLQRSAE
ncbi:MAG: M20 family peptidase [Hahellaceae bacterium]|nr:M20 family peptidase [Hahellaceae bacterium]MCP5210413.1 M20 family peptidase [Hahellaceae bacterium]